MQDKLESVTFEDEKLYLGIGETEEISYTMTPQDALPGEIQWRSSSLDVAIVSNGVITAVSAGDCIITAQKSDGTLLDTLNVKVSEKRILSESRPITCSNSGSASAFNYANVNDGDTDTRWEASKVGGQPRYPEYLTIDLERMCRIEKINLLMFGYQIWRNRAYGYTISVSTDGVYFTTVIDCTNNRDYICKYSHTLETPVVARYVKLTVTGILGGSGSSTASVREFTVSGTEYTDSVTELQFDKHILRPGEGQAYTVPYSAQPVQIPSSELIWESSDVSFAGVDYGVITGAASGSCTITASKTDGTVLDTIQVVITPHGVVSIGSDVSATAQTQFGDFSLDNITDGNTNTAWCAQSGSGYSDQYITLDLGDIRSVYGFETYFYTQRSGSSYSQGDGDRYYTYEILASTTGEENSYTRLVNGQDNTANDGHVTNSLDSSVFARYIRLKFTGCSDMQDNPDSGAGVYEFLVYADEMDLTPEIHNGVSIRTTLPTGIRFMSSVVPECRDLPGGVEYGFIVTRNDMLTAKGLAETDLKFDMNGVPYVSGIAYSKAADKSVSIDNIFSIDDLENKLYFTGVMTGIDLRYCHIPLTARPYLRHTNPDGVLRRT